MKPAAILALLVVANAASWLWALTAFAGQQVLMGSAIIAFGLGLRHAVDADHIAAIDNVTRALLRRGKRASCVGLFFSLGHSTIVTAASVALSLTASHDRGLMETLRDAGGTAGTLISALFLFAIAAMNIAGLSGARQRVPGDQAAPAGGGLQARLIGPLFRIVRHSWQMYLIGFLFGLGFDAASEIGLLGMSAVEGVRGLPIWSILIFPALFTAGMSLVDTSDGLLMQRVYGWAFTNPVRRRAYDVTMTSISIAVALLVGGIEVLGLVGDTAWIGCAIAAALLGYWLVSVLFERLRETALQMAESQS
jgi:high-affinity nickel-transport protein